MKPKEIVMHPTRNIRRLAAVLAGLAAALLAYATTPAFAMTEPVPGGGGQAVAPQHVAPALPWSTQQFAGPVLLQPGTGSAGAPVHAVIAGGMPGWQITLIAVGAALLAATFAVLLDRARATRRNPVTAAA